ncbi:hypothetical protein AVEN_67658-1 [Araneus ventricosus]|uniref:Uncharacterized protein n=1 Tax=Araneus ventricosus TaxID=182803 RepID=A0A4Y2QV26_ARAVE|nr:hypothetical protein AVEN_67658-1 [Araneus ventricosus]
MLVWLFGPISEDGLYPCKRRGLLMTARNGGYKSGNILSDLLFGGRSFRCTVSPRLRSFVDFLTNRFNLLLACLRGRELKEKNPNGLGASRMRAIPSEYSNEKTKESAFITEKTPPVKNVKT